MNITKHIGSGTFGDVYKGTYNRKHVAIKIQSAKKTEHEVYVLSTLPASPYICSLLHYGHSFIVIPLYACSVYDLLQTSDMNNGIPGDLSLKIIRQVLYACKHLHDHGFIYIDYKVNNVMLDGEHIMLTDDNEHDLTYAREVITNNEIIQGTDSDTETGSDSEDESEDDAIRLHDIINKQDIDTPRVKLIDYGLTTNKERVGSYCYAINEQASPEMLCMNIVSKSTDIWSIGIMLFIMITNMGYVEVDTTPSNDEDDYADVIEVLRMQCNLFGEHDQSYLQCKYFDEAGKLKTTDKCIPYSVSIYEYLHPIYAHDKVMAGLIDVIYKMCTLNVDRHNIDNIINAIDNV